MARVPQPQAGEVATGEEGHVGIISQVCNLLQSIDGLGQTKSNAFMETQEAQDGGSGLRTWCLPQGALGVNRTQS